MARERTGCRKLDRRPRASRAADPVPQTIETRPDAAETARLRQRMYALLSDCLLQPLSPELLSRLADPEYREATGTLLGNEANQLCAWILRQADTRSVPTEHAALFVVPGSRQTLPFETCYREKRWGPAGSGSGRVLGIVALQLQRTYVQWGMAADLDSDEFPDHAGVELRFMMRLVEAERHSRSASDAVSTRAIVLAEADFLGQHILQWFPEWLNCVRDRARLPFYRTVATLLDRFLESEKAALALRPRRLVL